MNASLSRRLLKLRCRLLGSKKREQHPRASIVRSQFIFLLSCATTRAGRLENQYGVARRAPLPGLLVRFVSIMQVNNKTTGRRS
jgi:hypothetical protein